MESDSISQEEQKISETEAVTESESEMSEKRETDESISGGETYDHSNQYASLVLSDGDSVTGGTYTAEESDESVIEASGDVTAEVTGAVLNKTSGDASSADASSFQGVNAGVRVYGDAALTLTDCEINASASNATGVFAYENGVIYMSDCTVNVTGGGAGGVQVAGGGTLYGTNLTVTSASKAAIRAWNSRTVPLIGAIQGEGEVYVTLNQGSSWVLTGDSYITAMDGDLSGLDLNGYELYIDGTPYEG